MLVVVESLRLKYGGQVPIGPWTKRWCEEQGELTISGRSRGAYFQSLSFLQEDDLHKRSYLEQALLIEQMEQVANMTPYPVAPIEIEDILKGKGTDVLGYLNRPGYSQPQQQQHQDGITAKETSLSRCRYQPRRRSTRECASANASCATATESSAEGNGSEVTSQVCLSGKVMSKSTENFKDGLWMCSVCGYSTKDRSNFRKHTRIHEKDYKYVCSSCSESFTSRSNLTAHEKRHQKQGQFVCEKCGKSFWGANNLASHRKCHENEKEVLRGSCLLSYCKKFGHNFDNLSMHLRAMHNITSLSVYKKRLIMDREKDMRNILSSESYVTKEPCKCPDHDVWIYKWVGKHHNCYLCECHMVWFKGFEGNKLEYTRMCKYSPRFWRDSFHQV